MGISRASGPDRSTLRRRLPGGARAVWSLSRLGLLVAVALLVVPGVLLAVDAAPAAASTSWQVIASPNPGTAGDTFQGVSCVTASDCIAVGSTVIEQFNGTTWTPMSYTEPTGAVSLYMDAVSCVSASSCTAVGTWGDDTGDYYPLAEYYNGSSWSPETVSSSPSTDNMGLFGVSCSSASDCIAVGMYYESSFDVYQTLSVQFNGTSGTVLTTPAFYDDIAIVEDVSCVPNTSGSASKDYCTAVGYYTAEDGTEEYTLIMDWNGSSWNLVSSVSPTPDYGNILYGVTCVPSATNPPATSNCTAVGEDAGAPLIEQWGGTSWTQTTTSLTSGTLSSVSCTSTTACTAVGSVDETSTMVLLYNGSSWTQTTSVNPGSDLNYLHGVSCVTGGCVAVGTDSYTGTGDVELTLAETDEAGPFAPGVNGVDPDAAAGGATVTITGAGFTNASAVDFGVTPAESFNVVSDTEITAQAPATGSGTVAVTVTTPVARSVTGYPDDEFTFVPPPTVSGVTPPTGTTAGGTLVTITGTGFLGAGGSTGVSSVDFGSTPATSFSVTSNTQIVATAPPGTGAVSVSVTDVGGSASGGPFTYSSTAVHITTTTLKAGKYDKKYKAVTLKASGGTTPYKWDVAPGSSLPSGMKLSAAGKLSGKPTTTGTFTPTFEVTDSSSPAGNDTKTLTLVINGGGE